MGAFEAIGSVVQEAARQAAEVVRLQELAMWQDHAREMAVDHFAEGLE